MTAAVEPRSLAHDRDMVPVVQVPLQSLRFHPRNIRTSLGDLTALTASIRAEGVLVPLMAERRSGGGLQLLHGHRRWAAADLAGLGRVPCAIVPQHTDDEAILVMLAENTARAGVAAADLQTAIKTLTSAEFHYSTEAIAERLGVDLEVILAWRAGRGASFVPRPAPKPAAARPSRPYRPPAPSIRPRVVHEVLARVDAGELDPAAVVEELRAWLGDWRPAEPPGRGSPPPVPSSPTPSPSMPSSPAGSAPDRSDPSRGQPPCVS